MRPSQKRQFRCWMSLWGKAGALFVVSMACLSFAAAAHKETASLREKSLAALEEAVRLGLLRAWPIEEPRVTASIIASSSAAQSPTSVIISAPDTGGPPPPNPQLGLTLTRDGTGAKSLSSPCAAGHNYYLEVSLDLRTWTQLSSTISTSTQVTFAVTEDPALGRVFYRLSGDAPPPPPTTTPTIPPSKGDTVPPFISPVTGRIMRPSGPVSPVITNEVRLNTSAR